jgi:hypothetical protein
MLQLTMKIGHESMQKNKKHILGGSNAAQEYYPIASSYLVRWHKLCTRSRPKLDDSDS